MRRKLWTIALLLVACGEDAKPPTTPPPPQVAKPKVTVEFEYRASTDVPANILRDYRTCVDIVGRTHIHASWRDYNLTAFTPEGDMLFHARFGDVPPGSHKIRVSDPNACPEHPFGAVTSTVVYANGVQLLRQADTPGSGGTEPGFRLFVHDDGAVSP